MQSDASYSRLSCPSIYSLELTAVCSNRCSACGNTYEHKGFSLSLENWKRIIDKLVPSAQSIKVTGGEPTLYPDFPAILKYLDTTNIPFALFTNARWHKPAEIIGQLLTCRNLNGLLISLHGDDAFSHEAFTNVKGSFSDTVNNMRIATDAGIRVHVSTVITKWNWNRIDRMVRFNESLGAKRSVVNRYIGPEYSDLEADSNMMEEVLRSVDSLRHKGYDVKFGNCIPQCFAVNSSQGCLAGRASCSIDPWGNIHPCTHSMMILGNILENQIMDVWNTPQALSWRTKALRTCDNCGELDNCLGGCIAIREQRLLERDPLFQKPLHPEANYKQLNLHENLKPNLVGRVSEIDGDDILLEGNIYYKIPTSYLPLIKSLDGQMDLRKIYGIWGQEALDLVGGLYMSGFVNLVS